jgi:hypothetical protein
MWSPSPCLNKLATSHRTQKCCSVRFLCPEEELAKSPRNGLGCDLQLKYNENKTQIEEPSSPLDSWHRISARAPLTPGSNPSVSFFFIDFEN